MYLLQSMQGFGVLSLEIRVDEMVNHSFVKKIAEVIHEMIDAKFVRDCLRVLNVGKRAAGLARFFGDYDIVIVKELERHARDLVSLVDKEFCRNRAVDSAAHRHQYFCHVLFLE